MPSCSARAGSSGSPARKPSGPPSTMNPCTCSVTITPPARRSLSSTVTSLSPCCVSSHAAASPAIPAPTTTTLTATLGLTQHGDRSEEHTSELQSLRHLVCRLLLEQKKQDVGTQ